MKKKQVLIGVGILAVIVAIIGTVMVMKKAEEKKQAEERKWFSTPENIIGRWVSDEDFSFLVYKDESGECHVRIHTDNGVFEGTATKTRAYTGNLEVKENKSEQSPQMTIFPVEKLSDSNDKYRVSLYYFDSDGKHEGIGQYIIHKDTLVDNFGSITPEFKDSITKQLNDALSQYYGFEVSSMDLDFDFDGIYDGNGGYVNYNGYIHGIGVITAATAEGMNKLGAEDIDFVIDPASPKLSIKNLKNTTTGRVIVDNVYGTYGSAVTKTSEVIEDQDLVCSEDIGPKENKVTKEEWQNAYLDVLKKESTYNGIETDESTVYLVDADDNGAPELYINEGIEPSLTLRSIYDYSTGTMESNTGMDVFFVPYVATNKKTGERVLYGDNGGMITWNTMMLRPVPGKLDFEEEIITNTERVWNEKKNEAEYNEEQISKEYKTDDFEVDYTKTSLQINGKQIPGTQELYDFLGITSHNPGGFESCKDDSIKSYIELKTNGVFNAVLEAVDNNVDVKKGFTYTVQDIEANKNDWGIILTNLGNMPVDVESIDFEDETGYVIIDKYDALDVDTYTQVVYGFKMDKGDNYENGKYVVRSGAGFFDPYVFINSIDGVYCIDKELDLYYITLDIGWYTSEGTQDGIGDMIVELVDTKWGKEVKLHEINIGIQQINRDRIQSYKKLAATT